MLTLNYDYIFNISCMWRNVHDAYYGLNINYILHLVYLSEKENINYSSLYFFKMLNNFLFLNIFFLKNMF